MERYQKKELKLSPRRGRVPEPHRAKNSHLHIVLSLVFLLMITCQLASYAFSSTLSSEQRERISEIDKELEQLRNGKLGERSSAGEVKINGIRHFANSDYARIVFDLTSVPEYSVDGDKAKGDVFRIIFKNTNLQVSPAECDIEPDSGLLKCVTARRVGSGIYVSIFSNMGAKMKVFNLSGPPRIVVDLFKGSGEEPPGDFADPRSRANVKTQERKIVVVIDPGHGGKDPGAMGPKGLKEKDVVLDIARQLKLHFENDGRHKVLLTRNNDVYLSLTKRTAIANGAGADLFISIHTNASKKRRARGISSFVLGKKATDREALELAMKENGVMIGEDSQVNYILRDLINYGKEKESLRLAKVINDKIVDGVRPKRKGVIDLGVKRAPFYVLFGAAMPAVLVETSFITNSSEEKLLGKSWYRKLIAHSIYTGIANYIDRSKTAFYGSSGQ